ncbi:hypothetical protein, partial [uncultured Desulfovibrio sp.]|uniref:hypothetical protein n=1 Tax=uncultured Desulfovibrio sp. TaxID=167968 RepID=UPI00262CCEC5
CAFQTCGLPFQGKSAIFPPLRAGRRCAAAPRFAPEKKNRPNYLNKQTIFISVAVYVVIASFPQSIIFILTI